jgi:hypothetical protein
MVFLTYLFFDDEDAWCELLRNLGNLIWNNIPENFALPTYTVFDK